MDSITIDPKDLLQYNTTYRILICRECQYAIQKSAVSSHLLRHKIYREERQRLLSQVATLELLEPEDVSLPPAESSPIEGLPVISGYRCIQERCENLCASLKRMKKHQSEVHGINDLGNVEAFACQVDLQTFFRGTKLRYFEVTNTPADLLGDSVRPVLPVDDRDIHPRKSKQTSDAASLRESNESLLSDTQSRQNLDTTQCSEKSSVVDLNILSYFHHYTTVTCHTLPSAQEDSDFWSRAVVELALKHQWLMCGVLAISSAHLASCADSPSDKEVHCQSSARFCTDFLEGLVEVDASRMPRDEQVEIRRVARRVECMLRCVFWTSTLKSGNDSDQQSVSSLRSLLNILPEMSRCDQDNIDQASIFARAKDILENTDFDNASAGRDPECIALLNRLGVLPERFSQAFGRPYNVRDVLTTLSATAALVVSCEMSFASDTAEVAWRGIIRWLAMTTEHFDSMLSNNKPAALVLVAYWGVLVKRAERCGMWFLQGFAERMIRIIGAQLVGDDSGLGSLLADLLDC